ncbi:PAS domain-containing protein [Tistrella mobilis]|uniref:PAS domain-containing protein n=1 Tax=Tistrella mobilis TaxID=171437 RepID=UPI003556B94F
MDRRIWGLTFAMAAIGLALIQLVRVEGERRDAVTEATRQLSRDAASAEIAITGLLRDVGARLDRLALELAPLLRTGDEDVLASRLRPQLTQGLEGGTLRITDGAGRILIQLGEALPLASSGLLAVTVHDHATAPPPEAASRLMASGLFIAADRDRVVLSRPIVDVAQAGMSRRPEGVVVMLLGRSAFRRITDQLIPDGDTMISLVDAAGGRIVVTGGRPATADADLVERQVDGFPLRLIAARTIAPAEAGWGGLVGNLGASLPIGLLAGAAAALLLAPARRQDATGVRPREGDATVMRGLELARAAVWQHDARTRHVSVLPGLPALGIGVIGTADLFERIAAPERQALLAALADLGAGRRSALDMVLTVPSPGGGAPRYLRVVGGALPDGGRSTGLIHDITETEVALRRADDRLRSLTEIQSLAGIASWSWPIGAPRVWCANELFSAFGLDSPPDGAIDAPQFQAMVLAEDRPRVREALRRARRGTVSALDFRLLRIDGRIVRMHGAAAPGFDDDGQVVRINGALAVDPGPHPSDAAKPETGLHP